MDANAKADWIKWLEGYGADRFYDAFIANVEGAESRCRHCGQTIRVDISVGGGIPDWADESGDYGCDAPNANGSHMPVGVGEPWPWESK